jgi:GDP-L-fucose synthase
METNAKIFVAGATGMLGSAIVRSLKQNGYQNILQPNRKTVDLTNKQAVDSFFANEQPNYVFIAAAKVGGILANSNYKADFLYQNLQIQNNTIHAAYEHKVKKLLFIASSCMYPKYTVQPIKTTALLSGLLEPTNDAYAIAKIAGLKLCEAYNQQYGCNFFTATPCNLYGINDTYNEERSHVIPALIAKMHEAKLQNSPSISLWGSGQPLREFLFADDAAAACTLLMKQKANSENINIGSGEEISIAKLAQLIAKIVGYNGVINFDTSMPDGTPRKVVDHTAIKSIGWQPTTNLENGIAIAYHDFLENYTIV